MRDIFKIAVVITLMALTFKREVNVFRQKGLQGWQEAATDFIQEITHPW